jgi:hypothetical protein
LIGAHQGGFVSNDEDEEDGWTTLEFLRTKMAVRDVARMTLQGAPKIELLAKYPELRDQDIDLATKIASAPLDSALYEQVDEVRFRRHPDRTPRVQISEFDKWVSGHNIPETFEYGKGWWDYVELVRRFAARLDTEDVRVIGHYVVDTPPPRELLPMPAIALSIPGVTFALRFDFGSWSWKHDDRSEWVVSVDRRSPYRGPLFGLFDENRDLRTIGVEGLAPSFLFGSYRQDPSRFSCLLRDEWDVATLLRLMAHEA